MTTFWILAGLMTAAVLIFIIPPFLRRPPSGVSRKELNLAVYRERLAELQAALDAGALDAEAFARDRQELDRELLADLPAAAEPASARRGRWGAVPAAAVVVGVALVLYRHLGLLPLPPGDAQPVIAQLEAAGQMRQIGAMVGGLARKLEQNPDDPQGWLMLARSYRVLEQFDKAAGAYAQAQALLGDQPWLLADYAEVAAYAQNGELAGRPATLVARALAQDPDNQKALWLAGLGAAQQGDAQAAAAHWRRLLAQLPADGEGAGQIRQLLAEVEQTTPAAASPSAAATLTAQIALAPSLQAQVQPTDTVFIFARAVDGPRLPLAVQRRQVRDLPATVVLDDSMAMVAELTLSRFPQVRVVAQVSRTGNAVASSGDLRGTSAPVTVGGDVAVTIDEVVP